MKRFFTLLVLFMTIGVVSYAQNTITGQITDEAGDPLIGANVIAKGTSVGTVTDFDGNFTFEVPDGVSILEVSYTGYATQAIPYTGQTSMDIVLEEGIALGEIVVTALGIERKKDEDLSSSSVVEIEGLRKANEAGVLQGLSGKTSGVNITTTSGDPGAGAYIQIRGQNTILADHQPLIVLDGAIISNANTGSTTDGVVQQSRLNDINPEDIESITVLKGASAAAIYGSNASNGVLVIKTKRGTTNGKSWQIDVKSSLRVDRVNVEWDKQNTYGQGFPRYWVTGEDADLDGMFVANTGFSYGDKIADRSGGADEVDASSSTFFEAANGNRYFPIISKNSRETFNDINRDQVFDDGYVYENSVGLSYSDQVSTNYLSFSRWDQDGIYTGNSDYRRSTVRFNNTTNLSDALKLKFNGNYIHSTSNRIQTGSNLNGLYLGYLRTSPDYDIRDFRGTSFVNGIPTPNSHRSYRRYLGSSRTFDPVSGTFSYNAPTYNNPLWTLDQQSNTSTVERFIIAPEVSYKITDNVSVVGRYSIDRYTDTRENYEPPGSASEGVNGLFEQDNIEETFQTYNVFVNSNFNINSNINFNAILGYQYINNVYDRISNQEASFTNPDERFLHFGNATTANSNIASNAYVIPDYHEETANSGVYGVLNFSLYDQVLVEISGRGERHSSIPEQGIIFYPAVSTGWVFSKTISTNNFFNFGKIRASYAEVANAPVPYATATTFTAETIETGWGDQLDNSTYGNPISRSVQLGNPDLKEERVKEFEVGVDARFLSNRLTIGATYYQRKTEDALLELPTAPSSGYQESFQNAAEIENKGFEFEISGDVVRNKNWEWNVYANASRNVSEVTDLAGVEYLILNGFTSTSSGVAEGQPFGVIRGGAYARNDDGSFVTNENGFPIYGSEEFIGDPNPDWIGGFGTSIRFKNFTLSGLLQTSQGADIWNGTRGVLNFFGINPETAIESTHTADLVNFDGVVIPAGTPFRGVVQDFGAGPVAVDQSWWTTNGGGFGDVAESFIEDGSWTRLRELTLSYNLPNSILDKAGIRDVQISVSGRNLALWTDVEGFDPESNLTGASKGRGLEYFSNPGSQSFITSIRFSF